jgi:hypothetical protein
MSHKFSLGQTVVFSPGIYGVLAAATKARITRLMPMEGADYQYDIQIESDGLQRRAREYQLRPARAVVFSMCATEAGKKGVSDGPQ